MSFEAKRLTKMYEMQVPAPREQVFPLLCPIREYDWLPDWRCQMIYSTSGVAEPECVFTTDLPDRGNMIWVVTRYEPPEQIQYTVLKPESHTWTLNIRLDPAGPQACRLTWQHVFTGLMEAGNRYLQGYTDGQHRLHLAQIEHCLVHYLKTGTMLKDKK